MKKCQTLVLLVIYFLQATLQYPIYYLNLALNKSTYSSTSVNSSQISNYSVDGYYTFLTGSSADGQQFYSQAGSAGSPNFWRVDLNSSYQIRTIFFSANEDTKTQAWNIGLEFRIGNSTTPSSNPVCFTTTYAFSQWIKIQPSGTCTGFGQYIEVTASAPNYNPIRIIELKAYQQVMINNNYYDYKYSSIAPYSAPQNIAKTELLVQTGDETSSFTTQQEAQPWLQFKIPESSDVAGFVVISERGQTVETYQNYIQNDLQVIWDCVYEEDSQSNVWFLQSSYLNDSNPESTPDTSGPDADWGWQYFSEVLNLITLKRSCSSCKLGVVSVAVLSNCDCSKTGHLTDWFSGPWAKKIEAMQLQLEVGEEPLTIDLYLNEVNDTISTACGTDGYSFCGSRTIKVYEPYNNAFVNLTTSNSISVNDTAGTITFKTKDMRDVGPRDYWVGICLKNYFSEDENVIIQVAKLAINVVPSQRMIIKSLGTEVPLINQKDENPFTDLQYKVVADDIKDYAFYTQLELWTQGFQNISSTTVNSLYPDCYNESKRCFWSLTNMYNPSNDLDKNDNYSVFVQWDIQMNRYFYVYQFGGLWEVHNVTLTLPESLPSYLHDKHSFNMFYDTNQFQNCQPDITKSICLVFVNSTNTIRMKVKEYRPNFKIQITGFLKYGNFNSTINFTNQIGFLINRCQINSVTPIKTNYEFSYQIGTSTQRFYLSSYKQKPECGYKITNAQAITFSESKVFSSLGIIHDKKFDDIVYMSVYDTNLQLGGKEATYQIIVEFEYTNFANKDVFVIINLLKGADKQKSPFKPVKPPQFIPPLPKIEEVSDRGVVTVSWSQEMTAISDIKTLLDGKNPALSVALEAGSVETDIQQLQLKKIQVLSYEKRQMKIKFLPSSPDQLSLNPNPDVVRINFFVYDNQMSTRLLEIGELIKFQEVQRRRELLTQFVNMTGTGIDANISITSSIPKQFGEKKVRGQTNIFGTSLLAKVLYYLVFGFLSEMIELIVSLSMIMHTLMISLSYPANLNTFCDFLYPIVTFDLVQSEIMHQYFFEFDSLNNTEPLSYQIGQIGYGSTLSIWNLGDIFYLVIFFPILVILMTIVNFLLKLCPSSHKWKKRTVRFLGQQIKHFMWNRCIRFIHTSFIVLTIVTLIQLKDLRLTQNYQWQERTCSYFVFVLLVPTILFPLFIFTLYWKKMERVKPLPEYDERMELGQLQYLYGTKNVEKIKKLAYTEKKHKQFFDTYGTLLKGLDLERNGKMLSIFVPCQEMLRFLAISFILVQFIKYPSMQINVFLYFQLYFISFEMLVKPLEDPIEQSRNTLNEICYMFMNYLMMGMTDYSSYDAKTNYGFGVMILTGITTFSNFYAYFVPKIQLAIQKYKRSRLRKIRKRKLLRLEQAIVRVAPNHAQKAKISPEYLAKIKNYGATQQNRKKQIVSGQNPLQEVSVQEQKNLQGNQVTDNAMMSTQFAVRSKIKIESPSLSAELSLPLDNKQNYSFRPDRNLSQLQEESYDANAEEQKLADFYARGEQGKRAEKKRMQGRNTQNKELYQTHGKRVELVNSFEQYEIQMQELQEKEKENVDNYDQLESILDHSKGGPGPNDQRIYQISPKNLRNKKDKQKYENSHNNSFDQQEKKYNDSIDKI